MTATIAPLPLTLSEADFSRTVIDTAVALRWRCVHIRPARTERGWRTPYEGDSGLPDLILARDGHAILAELKTSRGRPTPEQRAWLAALGGHGRLWRPGDWPSIYLELRDGPRA